MPCKVIWHSRLNHSDADRSCLCRVLPSPDPLRFEIISLFLRGKYSLRHLLAKSQALQKLVESFWPDNGIPGGLEFCYDVYNLLHSLFLQENVRWMKAEETIWTDTLGLVQWITIAACC